MVDSVFQANNFSGWCEVSARENSGLEEAVSFLVEQMVAAAGNDSEQQKNGIRQHATIMSAIQTAQCTAQKKKKFYYRINS